MHHHMDAVGKHHALTVWPAKDRVRVKSKMSVKAHCSFEIRDGDVDGYGVWLHNELLLFTRDAGKRLTTGQRRRAPDARLEWRRNRGVRVEPLC